MSTPVHILGFSGSLRKGSFNTGLMNAASELLPAEVTLEKFDLASIPLYNADIDGHGAPEAVRRFKERIAAADALLIVTPEYNYSVPGVLKNAIDWASRTPKDSPLNGKPVALMGAGGQFGTVRAQAHLRQILLFNGTYVLPKPEVYVARAQEKFDQHGNLTDEEIRERIGQLVLALRDWTLRLKPQA